MQRSTFLVVVLVSLVAALPALAQHEHGGDIVVGRAGSTAITADTLAIEADLDESVFLEPVSGLFNGWSSTSPGFDALGEDEPGEGFFTLAGGASIRLEILAIDAGFAVVQSGGGAVADAVGESILLGGSTLHTHPTWYAQSSVLGGEWAGTLSATFRLVDAGTTGYESSEPFTMSFTNVPEPGTAALAAVGAGCVMLWRRVG